METERQYTLKELSDLAAVIKHDPASDLPTIRPPHGFYHDSGLQGWASAPGERAEMFSTLVRTTSITNILTPMKSEMAQEIIAVMTGQTANSGTNAEDFCGDPPRPGNLKRCAQLYPFGRWFMKTSLGILPEMGELVDTADVSRRILNESKRMNPYMPEIAARVGAIDLGNARGVLLANEMFKLGVAFERGLEPILFQGARALGAGLTDGWTRQFDGWDQQIVTGRTDLYSGGTCPAVDSHIETFSANVTGTNANGEDILDVMTNVFRGQNNLADDLGMSPVQFVWAMTKRAFSALVEVWACNYQSHRCAGAANNEVIRMAGDTKDLAIQMRRGQFLWVDGVQVPVVFSDGIDETNVAGGTLWISDFYLIPINWPGGRLTWLQYKAMDNADITEFSSMMGQGRIKTMNNGMFLLGERDDGFCLEILIAAKMRLIQDAPFLAARVNDVSYNFYTSEQIRAADPGDTFSHVDGGDSSFNYRGYTPDAF